MPAKLKFNAAAKVEVKNVMAEGLLRAAMFFQQHHTQALARSYPPASKKGEYPRGRTWNLRQSVAYAPASVAEVAKEGRVRIGYLVNAAYGLRLERTMGRLGLVATLEKLKTRLIALMQTGKTKT